MSRHIPVLLHEVISFLRPEPGEFVIDGTIGGGGHAIEILRRISPNGTLLGVDLDETMIEKNREQMEGVPNVVLAEGNYADLPEILSRHTLPGANGLLIDLGFSSEQIEGSGRGFSFLKDEPLLMTYGRKQTPVRELLKNLSEEELAGIIQSLSGERFARRIAKAIKFEERKKTIETSGELARIVRRALPGNYEMRRIDPATRTFQALRMHANGELENLEKLLKTLPEVLAKGGRAVFISFHSLEDKLIKNYFKKFEKTGMCKILTKKPVGPSEEEISVNPRSRSAKLRAMQMI